MSFAALRMTGVGVLCIVVVTANLPAQDSASRQLIQVVSSLNHTVQPSYLLLPPNPIISSKSSLVVLLHSWSYGMEQRQVDLEQDAARRRSATRRSRN